MSRSVSAPSSVTKTSPCWNGLIVPGSTLRYGSNFWSCTRSPRAFSKRPSEAATMPFPSADTTPPVTKTYFGARALTGFQGSTRGGGRLSRRRANKRSELRKRVRGDGAADASQPRRLDGKTRDRLAVSRRGFEVECGFGPVARQLESDALHGYHVEEQQRPTAHLRPAADARSRRSLDLPERARRQRPPH